MHLTSLTAPPPSSSHSAEPNHVKVTRTSDRVTSAAARPLGVERVILTDDEGRRLLVVLEQQVVDDVRELEVQLITPAPHHVTMVGSAMPKP